MARSNHRAFFCHKRRFISPNFWFSPKSPFLATFFPNSLAHLKNYYYLCTPNPPLSPQSGGFFLSLFLSLSFLPRVTPLFSMYAHRMLIVCSSVAGADITGQLYTIWTCFSLPSCVCIETIRPKKQSDLGRLADYPETRFLWCSEPMSQKRKIPSQKWLGIYDHLRGGWRLEHYSI